MNILFLCPKFAVGGGGQTYTLRLGEELARLGHKVTICSEDLPNRDASDVSGVQWRKLKVSWWHQRFVRWLEKIKSRRGGERLIHWLFPQGDFPVFARTPLCLELKHSDCFEDADVVVVIMSAMFAWMVDMGQRGMSCRRPFRIHASPPFLRTPLRSPPLTPR